MNQSNEKGKRNNLLGIIFTVLAACFFINHTAENFKDIPSIQWNIGSVNVLFFSVILIIISIGNNGLIWHQLIIDQGLKVSWKNILKISLIAQFGKYLPGNIGQHIGRVYMAKQAGIPLAVTLNTILTETFWFVGVGSGLALLSLLIFSDSALPYEYVNISPMVLSVVFPVLWFLPWLCIRGINLFLPGFARKISGDERINEPKLKVALVVAVQIMVNFLIIGIILYFQADWFFGHNDGGIIELTCLFSIAWIAGYIVPGAPAGLGIREAIMVILLAPNFGTSVAIGLSITLRITTSLGDGLAFLIGVLFKRLQEKHNGNTME